MSNPTSNFGWVMPSPTDLVTDLPADFEVFGQAVDTSMADLKGGTTGQILSKASNTDMDFTWITNDVGDITAVTASSPLTGGGTSGAITVGIQDGTTSQKGAVQLTDSTSSTSTTTAATPNSVKSAYDLANSAYAPAFTNNYYVGKNKIINGDFGIWQRGTSFSNPATVTYTSDRWVVAYNGTGATRTISRQAFTAGTAPVAGYESQYFLRFNTSVAGTETQQYLYQPIEDVRTFAGKTITISYWAKADAGRTVTVRLAQNFGSGGSATVLTTGSGNTITTSWARYSETIAVPSISGKTLGTSSYLSAEFLLGNSPSTFTFDIWGVQVEAGSTATPFQTATGTIQGELAACQRYYYRIVGGNGGAPFGAAQCASTTVALATINFPVTMRIRPTALEQSGTAGDYKLYRAGSADENCTAVPTFNNSSPNQALVTATVAANIVAGNATMLSATNTTAYLAWSAEL